ncbi:hypothetical protein EZV62_002772 [Acer yangbiense]|uniref:Uncharacterized protein n=1 Tax=Acer yangbiense TaxID=1000413 RepID=A0A5C7IYB2_9ROSI|nr:hypothetical protein EZV62_002772 [Acer yangbiense]
MEAGKRQVSSTSSSFTADLFGSKEPPPPPSSSSGIFASILSPPKTDLGRNRTLEIKPGTANKELQVKKDDKGEDDPNGNNSNGVSRGNWWQGIHGSLVV